MEVLKHKISYEQMQAVLRRIQRDFGDVSLSLAVPQRHFVTQGRVLKIHDRNSSKQEYNFLLFNDIGILASEGVNSK